MTKTIAQLWYGNIEPVDQFGRNNPEIKQLEILMERNREKLESLLNDSEKDALKKYTDCIDEYSFITNEQAFCDGFCLGARITAEAILGAEQP